MPPQDSTPPRKRKKRRLRGQTREGLSRDRGERGEGALYFSAPRNRWVAVLDLGRGPTGKRRRISHFVRTELEAIQWLNRAKRDRAEGLAVGNRQTVAEFLSVWLRDVIPARNLAPATRATYQSRIKAQILPRLGGIVLAELRVQDVQHWLVTLQQAGLSPRTMSLLRSILRSALATAMRWRLVRENVAALTESPRPDRDQAARQRLTPSEIAALIRAAEPLRVGPLIIMGVYTGLRLGELLGLRWEDINVDAATLTLRGQLRRVPGGRQFGPTKTGHGAIVLPLPGAALRALQTQRDRQDLARAVAGRWTETGYIFTTRQGTPRDARAIQGEFKQALVRAQLWDGYTPHDLRHGFASLLVAAGVHPRIAQELLRHRSPILTLGVYSHGTATQRRAALVDIETVMAQIPAPTEGIG